ncbi:hypothetical protein MtrunA17_Chr4g0068261 [Medicago truncatula]|uniref:Uncharacterized protein n=1 Tax=Medicago truncatula TaxID=3880 RepID=I3SHI9_MEDTR|nr:uncharacterized protein LOC25494116 [Medicago truncatula]AFK39731.1 unknown [Medicago truncatula]KEH32342.1 hypothetical protein MTR_4g121923 [Medicago truncatula]RHN64358.1 hypothetical protein MtrunA17_Chr4g0068261 [Medicago truncatula]
MASSRSSLLQLLRLLDGHDTETDTDDELVEPQPRHSPNSNAVAPQRHDTSQDQFLASFNNTGTQNMKGLINNSGYTKGNGNGSIIFGGFDSSNRRYNY